MVLKGIIYYYDIWYIVKGKYNVKLIIYEDVI